jgi:acetyl-CoA synthetase
VIDDDGNEVAPGDIGEVAIHRIAPDGVPDPVFFLESSRTGSHRQKLMATGADSDLAKRDEDGYLWYWAAPTTCSRQRAMHRTSQRSKIAWSSTRPSPTPPWCRAQTKRGNVVKAFIVLAAGHAPSPALEDEIQRHVRAHRATVSEEIEFIDALPMTTTGRFNDLTASARQSARRGRDSLTCGPRALLQHMDMLLTPGTARGDLSRPC